MSGGISISFVDVAALLFDFDRVRFGLFRLFLVRNWCGCQFAVRRGKRSSLGSYLLIFYPIAAG